MFSINVFSIKLSESRVFHPEIDISVSKLLGFETFAKSLRVSVSEKKSRFRKNLVSEKSLGFGFGKFGFRKKVLLSKNLVSEKSLGLGFG